MKKRVLWILAALVALLCVLTVSASAASTVASGDCGTNLKWTLTSDGVLTINGTGAMDIVDQNSVPWYNCWDKITSVKIGSGVTTIGLYAFGGLDYLTSVTIPNTVTSIGFGAFSGCSELTSVTIPSSVTSIADWAFAYCWSFSDITIPNRVTSIGKGAFYDCSGLTSIAIPDSVTSIGNEAFASCDYLTSITFGKALTSIGEKVFYDCPKLTTFVVSEENSTFTSLNGVLFSKNAETLFLFPCGKSGVYTIPSSVTSIADNAFAYCKSLTGVVIPDSVTSIGIEAFKSCEKLVSATIGSGVRTIGKLAFNACKKLSSIIIPEGVTSIDVGTFAGCYAMTSLDIPNSMTTIGDNAFGACRGLKDVHYNGTEAQWNAITIGRDNTYVTDATIHFVEPEAPEVAVEVEGATPSFTIDTSALTGADNYAVITVGGKTERVEQSDWTDGTVSYGGLAAKDLTQTVTMGVYDAEGNLLAEQSVSVADALKEQLKAETDTKEIAKIEAMLHYGAAAQKYFGESTENLANSGIGAMADVSAQRKDDSLLKGTDFSMICGTSMVHEAVPQMKFYFTTDSKTVLVNGEEVELEASAAGYYYYTVDVAPEAFFETITVTVMDGDTVLATITDSVASYCARLYAQGGQLSKTLADALLNYGLAVKA